MKLQATPDSYRDAIITAYDTLEPGESDSWNPLFSDYQLTMRLSLLYLARESLRLVKCPLESMQILDIGCGTGRASRMYVDLGFRPEQITGMDLRPGTIQMAGKLNPAIRYLTQEELIQDSPRQYDWISLVTVVSSLGTEEDRKFVVRQAEALLKPGGYLFYYDLVYANAFAGGDLIQPIRLFDAFENLWHPKVRDYQFIPWQERIRLLNGCFKRNDRMWKYWLRRIIGLGKGPSHEAILLRKAVL
ncbi:MAG: class I SAM-dependent methyltransferase [Luteolibacter sp.]